MAAPALPTLDDLWNGMILPLGYSITSRSRRWDGDGIEDFTYRFSFDAPNAGGSGYFYLVYRSVLSLWGTPYTTGSVAPYIRDDELFSYYRRNEDGSSIYRRHDFCRKTSASGVVTTTRGNPYIRLVVPFNEPLFPTRKL
ncbi:hypothetical protein BXZ70DRAFT_1005522 [Cristinia sonorae]|uniref:Uncharacterized protein n=1 Tax=Cristinia sonorae TaxID=1940300 RepID=A0A8K0UTR8_9AGAR|nr:hypothetical protein BXZ70DRAFT_1005522 [Cristinia sonorae]